MELEAIYDLIDSASLEEVLRAHPAVQEFLKNLRLSELNLQLPLCEALEAGKFAASNAAAGKLPGGDHTALEGLCDRAQGQLSVLALQAVVGVLGQQLELLFGSVPNTLSELIRTAFIPRDGCRFIVADFSAIEARVLAWLAGEEWVLEEFRGRGKIYEATASRMFHIPQETIVKGHPNYEYRQKGKQATLSCGYGGGVGALKAMGAKMPEEEMQPLVDAWSAANPNIVAFWSAMDRAARRVIQRQETVHVGKVTLYWQDDKMFIRLPSGRNLCYQSPHFTENRFGGDAIGYYAPNAAGQMVEQETFGGKLAENATQAIARDILGHAMMNLEAAGYPIVFHVHDEAIMEVPVGKGSLEEACRIMAIAPEWAKDLPLRADGDEMLYYQKA